MIAGSSRPGRMWRA